MNEAPAVPVPAVLAPAQRALPKRMSYLAISQMTREELQRFQDERPHDAKRFMAAHEKRLRRALSSHTRCPVHRFALKTYLKSESEDDRSAEAAPPAPAAQPGTDA